jgi:hypothetical protein
MARGSPTTRLSDTTGSIDGLPSLSLAEAEERCGIEARHHEVYG